MVRKTSALFTKEYSKQRPQPQEVTFYSPTCIITINLLKCNRYEKITESLAKWRFFAGAIKIRRSAGSIRSAKIFCRNSSNNTKFIRPAKALRGIITAMPKESPRRRRNGPAGWRESPKALSGRRGNAPKCEKEPRQGSFRGGRPFQRKRRPMLKSRSYGRQSSW